nr:MAG TPA: Repressor protein CI [Caudoviricetes sp.]
MKISTFAQRLRAGLDARQMTQAELSSRSKISKSSISHYLKGDWEGKQDAVYSIAQVLNVSEAWLMGYDVPMDTEHATPSQPAQKATIPPGFEPMPEMVNLPVVGKIACGTPILAQQNIETYYQSPKEWRASMFLVCQGDSMEPFIKDGDMVAIREQQDAETDEIVAVMELDGCDGFATLKKLKKRPDRVELWPLNPEYEPIIYLKEEMNKLQIIGLAVGVIRRIHE